MSAQSSLFNTSTFTAFIVSAIAGFSDVFGFIALQQLFTAHITGNIVMVISYAISHTPGITSRIIAIPVFVVIAILVSVIIENNGVSKNTYRLWLLIEAVLFLGLMIAGIGLKQSMHEGSATFVLVAMLPVTAMAIHNTIMKTYLSQLPPTTVMTGNLTQFVVDCTALLVTKKLRSGRRHKRLIKVGWVLAGFVVGGSLSLTYLWMHFYAVSLVIILIVMAMVKL